MTNLTSGLIRIWVCSHFRFVWGKNLKKNQIRHIDENSNLRCNMTVFSASPSVFFATQVYSPKSVGSNGRTINFIITLKMFSLVIDSYVPPWTYSLLCNQKLTEFGCDSLTKVKLNFFFKFSSFVMLYPKFAYTCHTFEQNLLSISCVNYFLTNPNSGYN